MNVLKKSKGALKGHSKNRLGKRPKESDPREVRNAGEVCSRSAAVQEGWSSSAAAPCGFPSVLLLSGSWGLNGPMSVRDWPRYPTANRLALNSTAECARSSAGERKEVYNN